jgi:hypothetical protein
MKKFFYYIRYGITWLKTIANRVGSYVSLLNIGMLLFLTISTLKDKGYIHFSLGQYIIPIYIATIIIVLFLGYLEAFIFKGMYAEQMMQFKLIPMHPDNAEMKNKIDEMYNDWNQRKKDGI